MIRAAVSAFRFRGRVWPFGRATAIPAAIAAAVVLMLGILADRQNQQIADQHLRAEVLHQISLVRARLEGNIYGNIQLTRGLVSTIATEPDMSPARFATLAGSLMREHSQIRNIAAAPDLVVSMIYPRAGNGKAIGLDYRRNPQQREAAFRARDSGELVLAGPVDLVQGGRGFIARFPVFTRQIDRQKAFWGLVSVVIDVDRFYAESGLLDPALPIDVALSGHDGKGPGGRLFYGDARVLADNPVTADIFLPSGSWQIAAVPRGGWDVPAPNRWLLRALVLAAAGLVALPIWATGRLVEERRAHVDALREREARLERVSHRLELALDASRIGVWEFDIGTDTLLWDGRMNQLYGYPDDDGPRCYEDWRRRLATEDLQRAEREFDIALATRWRYQSQFRIVFDNGAHRVIRAVGRVYDAKDGSRRIVGLNWDVTAEAARTEELTRAKAMSDARNAELEAARARIEHNSLHDFLTGLPNRMYLDRVVEEQAVRCAKTGGSLALLHVDLDRFKQINDTLGHAAGDAMLVHAAGVIRAELREDDFVARTGGDEFVIVCPADEGMERPVAIARRLIAAMKVPAFHDGHECRFGVSIGIAQAEGAAVERQRLLVNADIALYRAKSRGRNRYEFFTDALQAEIVGAKQVADHILVGLERGEFIPFFQPQVCARTHEIIGVEALARWQHPSRGLLAPDSFVPIAQDLGVMGSIDKVILERALDAFRGWADAGLAVPRVSVNVSFRRLDDEGLLDHLRSLAIQPGTVSFELLESIYLDESDDLTRWTIDQIKDLGIDIEIDDFGTGYASIVSLTKLRPRSLKIDRQLVTPVVQSQSQRDLVRSIVDIGKSLGVSVVAEGIETMEHARVMRDLGCDVLQGYAFSRPLSDEAFRHFAADRRRRVAS